MKDKTKLYDFYDNILNSLVINTRGMTKRYNRRGYYIPNFNLKNKESLLLIEVVKIVNMFDTESNSLPLLIYYDNLSSFIQYLRVKFKLRNTSVKVEKATSEDIVNDFNENLEFVSKELNFPRVVYEEIYDAYYAKGAQIDG